MLEKKNKPVYLLIDNMSSSENEFPIKTRGNYVLKNIDQETSKLPFLGKSNVHERPEQLSQDYYFQSRNKCHPEVREGREKNHRDGSPINKTSRAKERNTNRSMITERDRDESYYKADTNKSFHIGREANDISTNMDTSDPSLSAGKYEDLMNISKQQKLKERRDQKPAPKVIKFPTLKGSAINTTATQAAINFEKTGWNRQHNIVLGNIQSNMKTPEAILKHKEAMKRIADRALDLESQVTCPYCHRSFHPVTAESHIPKCKFIRNRPSPPKQVSILKDSENPTKFREEDENTEEDEQLNNTHRNSNTYHDHYSTEVKDHSGHRTNKYIKTEHSGGNENFMYPCSRMETSFNQQDSHRNSSYDEQIHSHRSHHQQTIKTERPRSIRNRRGSLGQSFNLKEYENLVLPITQLDVSRNKKKKVHVQEEDHLKNSNNNRVLCKYCDGVFPAQTIQHHALVCRSVKLYQAKLWPAGYTFDEFLQRVNQKDGCEESPSAENSFVDRENYKEEVNRVSPKNKRAVLQTKGEEEYDEDEQVQSFNEVEEPKIGKKKTFEEQGKTIEKDREKEMTSKQEKKDLEKRIDKLLNPQPNQLLYSQKRVLELRKIITCKNCGSAISKSHAFCGTCGRKKI